MSGLEKTEIPLHLLDAALSFELKGKEVPAAKMVKAEITLPRSQMIRDLGAV